MTGYLLDTNIVSYWFTDGSSEHERVNQYVLSLPEDSLLAISAITLGEIEYGHRAVSADETFKQRAFTDFIDEQLPTVLNVTSSTRIYYGRLRADLFAKFCLASKKRAGLRPEQLIDPVTSLTLGIQENDLWIAAQALEYNLSWLRPTGCRGSERSPRTLTWKTGPPDPLTGCACKSAQ